MADDIELVYQLVGYPRETEWIEFKRNVKDPQTIGQNVSALANSAAYHDRAFAYKIWGVDDESHAIVGTDFDPLKAKGKGNQDLGIWLKLNLSDNANYQFITLSLDDKRLVVLKVSRASGQPVRFQNAAYIREGSSTTVLRMGSERETELWRRLQKQPFEQGLAAENLSFDELAALLDVPAYFELVRMRMPSDQQVVIEALARQELIALQDDGRYSVTNLGALLVARDLAALPSLRKRRLRVVRFGGEGRTDILDDTFFDEGYALALPKAQSHILQLLPAEDVLEGAFRRIRYAYPERAIRELLANTIIHQDLHDARQSPEVHLFANRIEFSNPGIMLVPQDRVLNAQPKTRNVALVNLLRQMDLCEEEGTGFDIVVADCEARHLAAPKIVSDDATGTTVTLFADAAFDRMSKRERKFAAYWHACLKLSQDSALTNTSLRDRFGLPNEKKDLVAMSRLIRECCDDGLIKEEDPDVGKRHIRYIPFWA